MALMILGLEINWTISTSKYCQNKVYENNRWSIRGTNDGVSAIIDNKGTIVDKLEKGETGILEGKVQLINTNTFYSSYGYLFSYIFSLIMVSLTLLTSIWKRTSSK